MRGWVLLVASLALAVSLPASTSHHGAGGVTAGIIHNGPDNWQVHIGHSVTHQLQGQVHSDGPRDLVIGVPGGFADCPVCQPDWVTVTWGGSDPQITYSAVTHEAGRALRIHDAAWAFTDTLRLDFTVQLAIGDEAPAGDWPFDLGILVAPPDCDDVCLGTGAVHRVIAHVPARPNIHIEAPTPGTPVATPFMLHGSAHGPATITALDLRINHGPLRPIPPATHFSTRIDPADLGHGSHTLTVLGTDSNGRGDSDTTHVLVDLEGPQIRFSQPHTDGLYTPGLAVPLDGAGYTLLVDGPAIRVNATDPSGIAHVEICLWRGIQQLHCTHDDQAPYESDDWYERGMVGRMRLTAEAYDTLGNRSPTIHRDIHVV